MQLPVTNPFLKEMMETFLLVGGRKGRAGQVPGIDFDELGVSEVVELLDDANMEAVIRDFGDRNPQEDPVIHFYELFLKEYDAKKRIQRGAFYTPKPVVSYIIRSVHELLQAEFGLEDGLASTVTWGEMARKHSDIKIPSGTSPDSPFIMILDIATGTGTFLVEAIDVILKTMTAKWQKQGKREQEITKLWNEYVPKHLLPRLYGYELMMAPYAIAHMKIGLKLFETGYQFKSDERVRVYLTNTLEPASDAQQKLVGILPALAHEAEAVNEIKRTVRFTAVVGNPPYSGHSVNNGDWINHLLRTQLKDGADSYFRVDGQDIGERNPKWLNDDYVKFVRYGQNRIAESESGILAFITNHGYLDNPTFRGMRQSLMASFPKMFLLNLHGNAKKKEAAPDGSKDENVFDIQQGVSIGIFTIGIRKSLESSVYHADLWGNRQTKYKRMYEYPLSPQICNRLYPDKPYYLFSPQNIDLRSEYLQGFMLSDIFPVNGVGMTTARDHMVIDFEEELLMSRAKMFRDSTLSNLDLCKVLNIPEKKGWNINKARKNIQQENDLKIYIKPVLYRPFDERLIFYHDSLVWRTVKQIMIHMLTGNNVSLSFHRREELDIPYSHFFVTRRITEHGLLSSKTTNSQAPLYLYPDTSKQKSFVAAHVWPIDKHGRVPNLSPDFVKAIEETIRLRFDPSSDGGNSIFTPEDIFHYIYAILYSQTYRSRYVEFLKIDFPRIPITTDQDLFRRLCLLGAELVDLHLLESPKINNFITTFHENGDCQITKVGDKGKTISHVSNGKGRLYINATAYFDGIPVNVWDFHIGGYRVCHKWLDERRKAGRSLYNDDISHYQKIVVALAETIRLMKEIDEVIEEHGGWPGAFVTDKQELP
jgi:predicted helicase